jgi:hypothetical protein
MAKKVKVLKEKVLVDKTLSEAVDMLNDISLEELLNYDDVELINNVSILNTYINTLKDQIKTAKETGGINELSNKLKLARGKFNELFPSIKIEDTVGVDASDIEGDNFILETVVTENIVPGHNFDIIELLQAAPHLKEYCHFKFPKDLSVLNQPELENAIAGGLIVIERTESLKMVTTPTHINAFAWDESEELV